MKIFSKHGAGRKRLEGFKDCHTWSRELRASLPDIRKVAEDLPAPGIVDWGKGEYDYSYDLSAALIPARLRKKLSLAAASLLRFSGSRKVATFTGMLDDMETRHMRFLLAALRNILAGMLKSRKRAIYAPLGGSRKKGEPFPLHSDLYAARMLWNIFDEVETDESGKSLFLSTSETLRICRSIPTLPPRSYLKLTDLYQREHSCDQFAALYDILHSPKNEWTAELEHRMEKAQVRIKFQRGEGYLLDDRRWLHGRDAPSGRVTKNRLHRLVFG